MPDEAPRGYASPPCLAQEIDPAYFDPLGSDPQTARDVARFRVAERERLNAARMAMSVADRAKTVDALSGHLLAFVRALGPAAGRVLSGYWPIRGEPDLRPALLSLHDEGWQIALPLVEVRAASLVFRLWTPETAMVRGHWGIFEPPRTAPVVIPDVLIAPLVGWDDAGFRLGHGGGYFDRTLAAADNGPVVIGTGLQGARIATIYPQPHDIPMSVILTEAGQQVSKATPP